MSSWSESVSSRCRGIDLFNREALKEASLIWEDSVVGPSGHVFAIGQTKDNKFFHLKYDYKTHEEQPNNTAHLHIFDSVENLKGWLRQLKAESHPKAAEILPIMRFFLT